MVEKIKKIGKKMISRKSYEDFLVAFLRPLVLLVLRPKYALRQAGQFLKPRNLMAWVLATRTRKVTASLLVAILVIAPLYGIIFRKETEAAWWNDMWKFRKKLTINKSQVAGELQNFPMLVSLTDTDLSTNAQSDGDDIVFTDAMGHKLSHEIESYTSGTGVLVAWVKIPNLSPAHNQDIYLYYGNSTCQTQQQPTDVWDENFKMVQHMNQDPSGGATPDGIAEIFDSTQNNFDGNTRGTMTSADLIEGKVGKSLDFDGTDDGLALPDVGVFGSSMHEATFSTWVKLSTVSGCYDNGKSHTVFEGSYGSSDHFYLMYEGGSSTQWMFRMTGSDIYNYVVHACSQPTDIQDWSLMTIAWTQNGHLKLYRNGVLVAQDSSDDLSVASVGATYQIARTWFDNLRGDIDESKLSIIERSPSWIQTEYNNQNNPSTFISINNQQQERPGAPIGYWPMNEGYGTTVHDESGGSNTGTVTGATWASESECVSGACLKFDGSGDEVDTGDVNY